MTPPTVAVTGTAEREVPPDSYTLTASIDVVAGSSRIAYDTLVARASELDATLAALPVEVDRRGVGAWQDQQHWHAQRTVRVTGRDFDRVADVASAVGRVADVAVSGPEWAIDKDNTAHAALQTEAVQAARVRAERYATALGGTLGGLVELSDTDVHHGRIMALGFSGGSPESGLGDLDLAPRAVPISASVHARWYLVLLPSRDQQR